MDVEDMQTFVEEHLVGQITAIEKSKTTKKDEC